MVLYCNVIHAVGCKLRSYGNIFGDTTAVTTGTYTMDFCMLANVTRNS